jgi:hypothetical protein
MRLAIAGVLAALCAQTPLPAGRDGRPPELPAPSPATQVIVFVSRDCPVSNAYAPTIQRLCRAYGARGVRCTLVYEDEGITLDAVRAHLAEYGYRSVDTRIDEAGTIARRLGATVTPEAAIVDARGATRYRGRIDNFYAALGRPRQLVTKHDLRDALDAVLADRSVERPRTAAVGCYISFDRTGRTK